MNASIASAAAGFPAPLQLLVVLGLVGLNGFFVASEFAIVKVRSSQLEALNAAGEIRARRAIEVTENLEAYLSATQLGITLSSLALGWVGEPFIARFLEPVFKKITFIPETFHSTLTVGIAFSIISFLHIVLGELAPKSIAISKPVPTTIWVSAPLAFFYQIFRPAIWFLNGTAGWVLRRIFRVEPVGEHEMAHSEEELRVILAESEDARQVTPIGKEILMNALDLRKRVVRDITTPRNEVMFLNTEDSFEQNLARAIESRHTRFPVCDDHLDNTLGLIHIKDLLCQMREPHADLLKIRRELLAVPERMPLEKLLSFFLSKHAHIALVLDEYGGRSSFTRVNDTEFVIEGTMTLNDLGGHVPDLVLESGEVTTVGGYITQQLGRFPEVGETLEVLGYEARVTSTDGRRVGQVHFRKLVPAEVTGSDEDED